MALPELVDSLFIGQSTLLSLDLLAFRAPTFLPETLTSLLFEKQWGYWILGLASAAILFYAGQHRARKGMAVSGAIIAALTILWIFTGIVFVTPKERLRQAHQGITAAAKEGDVDRLLSYLTDDFECHAISVAGIQVAKPQISKALKLYSVKGTQITFFRPYFSGPAAAVNVTMLTETEFGTVKTSWALQWDDIPDSDWKLRTAELKAIGDQPASSIEIPR